MSNRRTLRGFDNLKNALAEKAAEPITATPPPSDHASRYVMRVGTELGDDDLDLTGFMRQATETRAMMLYEHRTELHPERLGLYTAPEPKSIHQPVMPARIRRDPPRKRSPRIEGASRGSWIPGRDDNRHNPVPTQGFFD